jgi:hypothetical protein
MEATPGRSTLRATIQAGTTVVSIPLGTAIITVDNGIEARLLM